MDITVIREIVKEYYEKDIPSFIERDLSINVPDNVHRAIVFIGPRRAGKTYFLYHLMKNLDKSQRFYVNFEDFRFENQSYEIIFSLIDAYHQLTGVEKPILFFDEIQNIERWEVAIRNLIDRGYKIYLTGSNSKLLSKDIATTLRGRSLNYYIFPFSFKEFIKTKNISLNEFMSRSEKNRILNYLQEYLALGGYPEVVLVEDLENKLRILKEIWELTILKDVVERYGFKNIKALRLLIKALIESKEFSVHKFYNFLKSLNIKISKNTLYEYLNALTDVLVVFPVYKFSSTYKDVARSIPKIYLVDNGLYLHSHDNARRLENVVFMHLKRQENIYPLQEIYYYVTSKGKEIDFLIKNRAHFKLIEVAYVCDEAHQTKIFEAMEELEITTSLCITWDERDVVERDGKYLKILPLWEFLIKDLDEW